MMQGFKEQIFKMYDEDVANKILEGVEKFGMPSHAPCPEGIK